MARAVFDSYGIALDITPGVEQLATNAIYNQEAVGIHRTVYSMQFLIEENGVSLDNDGNVEAGSTPRDLIALRSELGARWRAGDFVIDRLELGSMGNGIMALLLYQLDPATRVIALENDALHDGLRMYVRVLGGGTWHIGGITHMAPLRFAESQAAASADTPLGMFDTDVRIWRSPSRATIYGHYR